MPGFDVDPELVRRLAALLEETGLTEIEYQEGRRRIRVGRGVTGPVVTTPAPSPGTAGAALPGGTPAAETEAADATHPGAITAPMVGTAYLQPEPGSPHFVQEGDQVKQGDTLLIIEAMKVMNQILASRAGTVRQILVSNGAPVEYGEVLIILE